VNLTQQTGADGSYHFQGLRQGVYAVTETQPAGYDEGKNSVGSAGGTLGNDQIFNIHLTAAVAATNYNFGELTPTSQILVSSFTCPNFSFGHPDLIILSKVQFLSTIPASTNNPVLIAQATYVDGLYRAILGRPADEPALISWVLQLHQGLSPMQLVQDLWNSAEHRGLEVDDFYQTILHRGADAMGRAIWVNVLQAGASEADVESMLYASAEYQSSHPDNNSFVTGLYADVLSRNASSAEIAGFVQALQNGASRQQVARIFLTSTEAYMQSLDCDYRSLLRRVPDNQGEQTWLAMLGSGQIMPATVTQIFLSSNEFIADAQQASMS